MNEQRPDPLDLKLAQLQPEVLPARDLWPGIAAALTPQPGHADHGLDTAQHRASRAPRVVASRLWQLAAVLLLMVASSAATYVLAQRGLQRQVAAMRQQISQQLSQEMQPVLRITPASFGYQRLGFDYARTHAQLDMQFTRYLATLPPAERIKVERSLADLRRVARDLSARLSEHPSDPLLQELLLSTYQNELGLLSRVTDLGTAATLGANL